MAELPAPLAALPQSLHTEVHVTVAVCAGPRQVHEHLLTLPAGATVRDALQAAGMATLPAGDAGAVPCGVGIWGRTVPAETALNHGDRVEVYRPLQVDPKVARRERFARQGARSAGLFARQRPGGKAGY